MREDYETNDVAGAAGWERAHGFEGDDDRPSASDLASEAYYDGPDTVATGGIRCAHCKGRHATVADVRWCGDLQAEQRAEAEAEQAAERASEIAYARSREAISERGGPDVEAEQAEAQADDPWSYATALGYAGECEGGRCDVYNRCKKHRAQDVANGDRDGMFRSYND